MNEIIERAVSALENDCDWTTRAAAAKELRGLLVCDVLMCPEQPVDLMSHFEPTYREVVQQLAKEMDMSEMAVVRTAIRFYQAERDGKIRAQNARPLSLMTFGSDRVNR